MFLTSLHFFTFTQRYCLRKHCPSALSPISTACVWGGDSSRQPLLSTQTACLRDSEGCTSSTAASAMPPVCVRDLLQLFVPIKEQEVQPVLYSFSALFTVSLHRRRGSSSSSKLHPRVLRAGRTQSASPHRAGDACCVLCVADVPADPDKLLSAAATPRGCRHLPG